MERLVSFTLCLSGISGVIIGKGAGRGASEVKGGDSSSVPFTAFRRRR
jgi:hypothetical protein